MTNENLDTINLTSSGSTVSSNCSSSSSSSSASSTASNCSPDTPNGCSSNPNSYITITAASNAQKSLQLDEMTANFGLIMKDLKNVSTTLNLLARQIDLVVNKMDSKFNLIIDNMNNMSNGNSNPIGIEQCNNFNSSSLINSSNFENSDELSTVSKNKKIIKVIDNSSTGGGQVCAPNFVNGNKKSTNYHSCNNCCTANNSNRASSSSTFSSPSINNVSAQTSLNKCCNGLKKQTTNVLANITAANETCAGRRALSDRKIANFCDGESTLTATPTISTANQEKDKSTKYATLSDGVNSSSNRPSKNTSAWNDLAMTSALNGITEFNNKSSSKINTLNGHVLSRLKMKCTRSKSQPAFAKDANYSFVSSMFV